MPVCDLETQRLPSRRVTSQWIGAGESVVDQSGALECDRIADSSVAAEHGAGLKFNCLAGTENHRRHPPRLKRMTDADDRIVAVEKNDIDREAHKEHMHPYEGLEAPADEKHAGAGFESIAPKQSSRLSGQTAGILDLLAQRSAASRLIARTLPLLILPLPQPELGRHSAPPSRLNSWRDVMQGSMSYQWVDDVSGRSL
jgi:hypothetical protein